MKISGIWRRAVSGLLMQCVLTVIFYFLSSLILGQFGGEEGISFFAECLAQGLILLIGVGGIQLVAAYFSARKTGIADTGNYLLGGAIGLSLYVVLSSVLDYQVMISGAAMPLSAVLYLGKDLPSEDAFDLVPEYLPFLVLVGSLVLFRVGAVLLRRLGAKRMIYGK